MKTAAIVQQEFLNAFSTNMSNPINMDKLGVGYKAFMDAQKAASNISNELISTSSPYGVLHNQSTDEYYRLGHSILAVQMQFRRCVCLGNPAFGGIIKYYLHPDDSTKKADGTDASADVAGANGYQVFVEVPKTYVKKQAQGSLEYKYMATSPFEGCETHSLFRRTGWSNTGNGTDALHEVANHYFSAFENVLYDASAGVFLDGNSNSDNTANIDLAADMLKSVAGFKPYTGLTRAESRTLIQNGVSKQFNVHELDFLELCFEVEFLTKNSQTIIDGYTEFVSGSSYDAGVVRTGLTLSLGNNTGSITGKASDNGGTNTTTRVISMSYRGIENIFGHLWQWVDGVNISNWQPFIINTPDLTFADNIFTGDYVRAKDCNGNEITMPNLNGFMGDKWPGTIFPRVIGASSLTHSGDYYWQASGSKVLLSGASLSYSVSSGLSALLASNDSSGSGWNICAR